jgi:hypothetical protein
MVRRKIADEYRRMNLNDQSAFRRWLVINTVVGAISFFALIAIASIPRPLSRLFRQYRACGGSNRTLWRRFGQI